MLMSERLAALLAPIRGAGGEAYMHYSSMMKHMSFRLSDRMHSKETCSGSRLRIVK